MNKILNKLQLQLQIRVCFNTSQRGANPGEVAFLLQVDGSITGVGWGGGTINGKAYKWKFTVCLKNDT